SEITFQLVKRGPALLRVELHLVGAGRRRSAILDSVCEQVVVNLDVAIPCGCDPLKDPDVPVLIRVDRDVLLLRDDHPSLREIVPHDPANEELPERLFQSSLALCCAIPNEPLDARQDYSPSSSSSDSSSNGMSFAKSKRKRSWSSTTSLMSPFFSAKNSARIAAALKRTNWALSPL